MLFDRLMTAGRASLAWQENRPRITGPYQGAMLSVARKDLSHETQNGPTCLRSTREPVQTGKMPLVASGGDAAQPTAHFSQDDHWEKEWMQADARIWATGLKWSSLTEETRPSHASRESDAKQTKISFQAT